MKEKAVIVDSATNEDTQHSRGASCLRVILLYGVLPIVGVVVVLALWFIIARSRYQGLFAQVEGDLDDLARAAVTYHDTHQSFPDSLQHLVDAGILDAVPTDRYSIGSAPYGYWNLNNGEVVAVYSVGPDALDNHGIGEPFRLIQPLDHNNATETLYIALLQARLKIEPENGMSKIVQAFVEMRREPLHSAFLQAASKATLVSELGWTEAAHAIAAYGADVTPAVSDTSAFRARAEKLGVRFMTSGMSELERVIELGQPTLEHIREGLAKQITDVTMAEITYRTPTEIDLYTPGSHLSLLLLLEGRWHEGNGRILDALRCYLTAVRLADLFDRSSALNQWAGHYPATVGFAHIEQAVSHSQIESKALRGLYADVRSVADSLLAVRERTALISEEGKRQIDAVQWADVTHPLFSSGYGAEDSLWESNWNASLFLYRTAAHRNSDLYCQAFAKLMETTYAGISAFNQFDVPALDTDLVAPTVWHIFSRSDDILAQRAAIAGTLAVIAIEYYRSLHCEYPETLDEAATAIGGGLQVDPYADKPLVYYKEAGSFRLFSTGQDQASQNGRIIYDPTNGSRSEGDLLFGR